MSQIKLGIDVIKSFLQCNMNMVNGILFYFGHGLLYKIVLQNMRTFHLAQHFLHLAPGMWHYTDEGNSSII